MVSDTFAKHMVRYGINDELSNWTRNFLNGRSQYEKIGCSCSEFHPIMSGVHQGSVLAFSPNCTNSQIEESPKTKISHYFRAACRLAG